MFNDLDAKFLDGRRILSVDSFVIGDEETEHAQRGVHFADEKNPKVAIVHKDELEYLTFDNEEDSIKKRGPAFSTATASLQQDIMNKFRFYNLKFKELKPVMDNIQDSLVVFSDRFNRAVFGGEDGKYDRYTLKLMTIIQTISKAGKEVDYSAFTANGAAILKCLLEINAGYEESKYLIGQMVSGFDHLHAQATEAATGISGNEMRLRDMIDFTESYEATHGMPDEIKAMQTQHPETSASVPTEEAPSVPEETKNVVEQAPDVPVVTEETQS